MEYNLQFFRICKLSKQRSNVKGYAQCKSTGADQRILGDSEFVQEVISGLDDLVKKNLRLSGRRMDINTLARQVCEKFDISLGELRSGSRRQDVVEAHGSISWIAVRELGYSGADVARYLGVTNSCVTRRVASGPKPDVKEFIRNL